MSVRITQQDKFLLDLVASKEATNAGGDPYTSYYPSSYNPSLTSMTLTEVARWQKELVRENVRKGFVNSSASGRYQFVQATLQEAIDSVGLDRNNTRFTADVQDVLIIDVLKRVRRYDDWLAGSITTEQFQFNLSGEFESVPLPCSQNNATKRLGRIGTKRALHDCDTFFQALEDIKNGSTGRSFIVDVTPAGKSGASPSTGSSAKRAAELATSGNNYTTGGHSVSQNPSSTTALPDSDDPYFYEPIDFYDDRYDFRTGKKIRDIGINGVNPVSANARYNVGIPSDSTGVDTPGVANSQPNNVRDWSEDDIVKLLEGEPVGSLKSEVVQTPAGPQTVVKRTQIINTPAGPREVNVDKQFYGSASTKKLPQPTTKTGPF